MSNFNHQNFDCGPGETKERSIEEGEIVESGEESDAADYRDESRMREVVLALPAMSIREEYLKDEEDYGNNDDDPTRDDAASAAAAIAAAAEEAEAAGKGNWEKGKGKEVGVGSGRGKGHGRIKKRLRLVAKDSAGAGTSGEVNPKKKAPELIDPPPGEPTCPICNRKFSSLKAAFGHQRAHRDRTFRGFSPPPKFTPPSSPERHPEDPPGSSVGASTSAAGGSSTGEGRRLGLDLNSPPPEEHDLDLNKTPPKEDSDEDET